MKLTRTLLSGLILAGSCSLFAGDYDSLLKTIKSNWPDRKTAAVVCDLERSRFAVADIAAAARAVGITLKAVNVKNDQDVDSAKTSINNMRPDFIVLVDTDPVLGTAGRSTKSFISSALNIGVPSVGTSGDFLKVSGALAVGPKTSGKILASGRLTRSLRLKVPEGTTLQ